MPTSEKWMLAGGLAMALIAVVCAAALVKLALDAMSAPVPPFPTDGWLGHG